MNYMDSNDNMTILAVPCDQVVVLPNSQGEKLLDEIKRKQTSKEEKARIAQDAKVLFSKPDKK